MATVNIVDASQSSMLGLLIGRIHESVSALFALVQRVISAVWNCFTCPSSQPAPQATLTPVTTPISTPQTPAPAATTATQSNMVGQVAALTPFPTATAAESSTATGTMQLPTSLDVSPASEGRDRSVAQMDVANTTSSTAMALTGERKDSPNASNSSAETTGSDENYSRSLTPSPVGLAANPKGEVVSSLMRAGVASDDSDDLIIGLGLGGRAAATQLPSGVAGSNGAPCPGDIFDRDDLLFGQDGTEAPQNPRGGDVGSPECDAVEKTAANAPSTPVRTGSRPTPPFGRGRRRRRRR